MTIEVRQMTVKTHVVPSSQGESSGASTPPGAPAVDMQQLLEACRRMLAEMLRERRER